MRNDNNVCRPSLLTSCQSKKNAGGNKKGKFSHPLQFPPHISFVLFQNDVT